MSKKQASSNGYDFMMQKGINCLAGKKEQKFYRASNLFSKAIKEARDGDEKALAFQMLGKAQYHLKEYGRAEKSLKCGLSQATNRDLINVIRFDIAMVNLHAFNKICVTDNESMTWILSVTKAKRWEYIFKSIVLSIKTRKISNLKNIFKIIGFVIKANR